MTEHYDLVVIGGGIHGVGIAQAAACAGHSALLLEQTALASGTSSRSSKLIHGGLRYLEHGDFALVRENLAERRLLLRLAPELVRLVPFHIPVYRDSTRRPLAVRAGLALYALLGGLDRHNRFTTVPQAAWGALDGLETHALQALFRYHDAQTDDAALTRAVMQSAIAFGAAMHCPAEFLAARIDAGGCEVSYRIDGREQHCMATILVNAAGPWALGLAERISPRPAAPPVDLVQGAHLVLGEPLQQGGYYLEAPHDRRGVFLLPWGRGSLLGTTEHLYRGSPQAVTVRDDEERYLLGVLQRYFPQRSPAVIDRFAGLRVLPRSSDTTFRRSRETQLVVDDPHRPHLLSVYGGKLTGYRATAQKALRLLAPTLPTRRTRARTDRVRLEPAD